MERGVTATPRRTMTLPHSAAKHPRWRLSAVGRARYSRRHNGPAPVRDPAISIADDSDVATMGIRPYRRLGVRRRWSRGHWSAPAFTPSIGGRQRPRDGLVRTVTACVNCVPSGIGYQEWLPSPGCSLICTGASSRNPCETQGFPSHARRDSNPRPPDP